METRTPGARSKATDTSLMRRTAELALNYLDSLESRPVAAHAGREQLLAGLGGPLADDGRDPLEVIEDLAAAADPGLVASAGPRYFGFVIGGSLPAALAADWLTSAWDQNAGLFAAGPAASVAEEVAGSWLVDLLGLPEGTSFGLTTGCQMAHFTCLAAARHSVLKKAGWDVEEQGLFGAPEIEVIVGSEAHATVHGALQFLGLGRARVTSVESDAQGRMRVDDLERKLPPAGRPVIVCLQAGNVNSGSFDPLTAAIAVVREVRPEAWIHIDGAFGLWAAAVPSLRHRIAGYEGADSWSTDAHKWLNVPYDCGLVFVSDPEAHRAAMGMNASYLPFNTGDERDPGDFVPELSRRARGFPVYAALRALGRSGVVELVERCCELARRFADGLAAEPGTEILNEVVLNQVLVRFDESDDRTRDVVARLQADATAWFGGGTWHGKAVMRISVISWWTRAEDVDRSLDAIRRCLADSRQAG